MKYFITTCLLLFISTHTPQVLDSILYKGKKYELIGDSPFEEYLISKGLDSQFQELITISSSACWRGFEASWRISNNKLYLTGIKGCETNIDYFKSEFIESFDLKFDRKGIWFQEYSGTLRIGKGKNVGGFYDYYPTLSKEVEFTIEGGEIVRSMEYDNSKTYFSNLENDPKEFVSELFRNIKIDTFDLSKEEIFHASIISGNHQRPIKEVNIIKSSNPDLNSFVKEAILEFPEWTIRYKDGKIFDYTTVIKIIISQETFDKYSREEY